MRQSRTLTLLFAVLALGSLVCPVAGQETSGSEVWRSGVGDPVMAVALSEDGLYSPVITDLLKRGWAPPLDVQNE